MSSKEVYVFIQLGETRYPLGSCGAINAERAKARPSNMSKAG